MACKPIALVVAAVVSLGSLWPPSDVGGRRLPFRAKVLSASASPKSGRRSRTRGWSSTACRCRRARTLPRLSAPFVAVKSPKSGRRSPIRGGGSFGFLCSLVPKCSVS
jgi:hypothetical protein